jgi:hypothetical protein
LANRGHVADSVAVPSPDEAGEHESEGSARTEPGVGYARRFNPSVQMLRDLDQGPKMSPAPAAGVSATPPLLSVGPAMPPIVVASVAIVRLAVTV